MEIVISSLDELDKGVQQLLQYLGDKRILAFRGEIGAGKTTFIQSFCHHFGVREQVTSPTFSLVNEYSYRDERGRIQYIYHMDLYRLKRMEEALDFGIEEYLYDDHYCLIEWPEIVEEILPEDTVWINLQIVNDSTRKMLIL
ncbi:tRNA (adenosine(37)-N6)-threonylcarbamoyltransferase complex ATPase subunit type 1 TsaE [Flavilitoribacter nigricans]|uniref:tRNA (adenosine(37)-N6)-threonylcarbamoyltransferase complex ATPase subunit type 1 TsaE n=1 Tax=Flavilitoribacter nigricans TaxID=70997 RepID=UPI001C9E4CCF|nr:tRNA (adenosine(37)-N6)-threonylcarbamoyltransferase complex ATPase subunit type 1 TsaE [Flavilitoribacter nigricans]